MGALMFMSPEADHYSVYIYKYTEERTGLPLFLICHVQNSSCNKIGKKMVVCVDITTMIREDIVEYQISIYVGFFL